MKAIILAAGEGVRLHPFTINQPKSMVEIANKPILEYVINALSHNGINEIILVIGFKKERIMDYFKDGIDFGVNITYVVQSQQLGTAHAIKQVRPHINDGFLVLNGDNLIEPETINDIISDKSNATIILTVMRENPKGYGVVIAKSGEVTKIVEKPETEISKFLNTGIYRFQKEIFNEIEELEISERGELEITDAVQRMIDKNYRVQTISTTHKWMDVIYPWNLIDVNSEVLNKSIGNKEIGVSANIENNVTIRGIVSIGENTIIRSGTYIIGPVKIGNNCDIAPNTVILPSTTIGNNVTVGSFTEIKNSIIMHGARIGTLCVLSNSIIGENVIIGSHNVYESKKTNIIMRDTIHSIDVGAIIGENCIIESSVNINPGTIVGADCQIGSGNTIIKSMPNNSNVM